MSAPWPRRGTRRTSTCAWRPALISQVYDPNDPKLHVDPQFGVTRALIGDFVRHDTPHPSDASIAAPWYSLDYTYVMEAGPTALPRAPIK